MQSNGYQFHGHAAGAEKNAEKVISLAQRTSLNYCKPEKSCQLDNGVESSPQHNVDFSKEVSFRKL
jgi:hypothetical protein